MKTYQGTLQAKGLKIAIVVSRFNQFISERLLEGALDALRKLGAAEADLSVYKVPGSFEVPLVVKKIAASGKVDGILCLGALIRGDTPAFRFPGRRGHQGAGPDRPRRRHPRLLRHPDRRHDRAGHRAGRDQGGQQGLRRRVLPRRDPEPHQGFRVEVTGAGAPTMGKRRKARESALQILFQLEFNTADPDGRHPRLLGAPEGR